MESLVAIPLLIGGLILLFIFSILVTILPTILNLGFSIFIGLILYKKTRANKYLCMLIGLLASIIIGLNFRIPIVFEMLLNPREEVKIYKTIEKSNVKFLKISTDLNEIVFLKKPFSTIGIGGNEGCMCLYYTYPKNNEFNVKNTFLSNDIPITFSQESEYTAHIRNTSKSRHILDLSIEIFNQGRLISSANKKFIKSFPVSEKIERRNSESIEKLFLYLLQGNFWNYLLNHFPSLCEQTNILDELIRQTFRKTEENQNQLNSILIQAHRYLDFPKEKEYSLPIGKSGDIISFNSNLIKEPYRIRNYSSTVDNIIYPVTPQIMWHNIEKVLAIDDNIYFIKTGAKQVVIEKYTRKGVLVQIIDLELPQISWTGYPRKPLIYFKKKKNLYQIGLLEFGEEIDSKEYFFYFTVPELNDQ